MTKKQTERALAFVRDRYGELGVDVNEALRRLAAIRVSLHCWQGDDVGGFEASGSALGGGLAVTGNYPGKARTPQELRADLEQALALIPGRHRVSLHAMYGEFDGKRVDRDEVSPQHFRNWIAWAKENRLGLDFGFQSDVLCPSQGSGRLHFGAFNQIDPRVLDRARTPLP